MLMKQTQRLMLAMILQGPMLRVGSTCDIEESKLIFATNHAPKMADNEYVQLRTLLPLVGLARLLSTIPWISCLACSTFRPPLFLDGSLSRAWRLIACAYSSLREIVEGDHASETDSRNARVQVSAC